MRYCLMKNIVWLAAELRRARCGMTTEDLQSDAAGYRGRADGEGRRLRHEIA